MVREGPRKEDIDQARAQVAHAQASIQWAEAQRLDVKRKQDDVVAKRDEIVSMADEPGHQELCNREQRQFLKAILEDEDLSEHARGAIDSLRIVLAADRSIRTGEMITLA